MIKKITVIDKDTIRTEHEIPIKTYFVDEKKVDLLRQKEEKVRVRDNYVAQIQEQIDEIDEKLGKF